MVVLLLAQDDFSSSDDCDIQLLGQLWPWPCCLVILLPVVSS